MDLNSKVRSLFSSPSFLSQVDEILAKGIDSETGDFLPEFTEIPVDFKTFVESTEHMGFPALSERQLDVARFMLGNDPNKTFTNENTLAVLEWGKGSGKDSLACLILLYIVYYCLCLKEPQKFFKLPTGEPLDLLNVAYSARQANDVFFEKFKQRIIRWNWLKRKYQIKLSGIYLKQMKNEELTENTVTIIRDGVLFPKLIRAFSGHSQQESLEGRNLLVFILDEASAFKDKTETHNADKIFGVLQSSATSRFGERWKGFILSYPRFKGDFTERMHDIAEGELHWYSDKGSTWDVKPLKYFSGRWVTVDSVKVPREFEKEFKRDPQEAKCKYMCFPPEVEEPFIEYPEKIDACLDFQRKPLIILEDYEDGQYVKKRIVEINSKVSATEYVVTIDLGLKGDSAALSICHKELSEKGALIVQDAVTAWIPNRSKNLLVNFPNIEEILSELGKHITIIGVYFDQWQSTTLIQRLSAAGIHAEEYKLGFQDYKNFKEKIYAKQISLLPYMDQVVEMRKLALFKGNKVDHPRDGSKDLADTVVGAVRILITDLRRRGVGISEGGEFVGENLSGEGSFL